VKCARKGEIIWHGQPSHRAHAADRPESRAPQGVAGDTDRPRQRQGSRFSGVRAADRRTHHERKGTVGKAILRELVSEFIAALPIPDPVQDRAIAILEQLLTRVLPQLKESEEFNRLASAVLGEEIEQRRQLRARCLEDTPT
jgi:hypothetical protein